MLELISFNSNGDQLAHAGEKASFYALTYCGKIIDYFGTLDAVELARVHIEEVVNNINADTVITKIDFKIAA
jgi:hypothetical protein